MEKQKEKEPEKKKKDKPKQDRNVKGEYPLFALAFKKAGITRDMFK